MAKKKITIDGLAVMVSKGFAEVHEKMDKGFVEVHEKMDKGFAEVNERLDKVEQRLDNIQQDNANLGTRVTNLEFKISKS